MGPAPSWGWGDRDENEKQSSPHLHGGSGGGQCVGAGWQRRRGWLGQRQRGENGGLDGPSYGASPPGEGAGGWG